jgi:hypothetical protein
MGSDHPFTGVGFDTYDGIGMVYLDSPSTTSATTYQVYWKTNATAGLLNADTTQGSIVCMEIKG